MPGARGKIKREEREGESALEPWKREMRWECQSSVTSHPSNVPSRVLAGCDKGRPKREEERDPALTCVNLVVRPAVIHRWTILFWTIVGTAEFH